MLLQQLANGLALGSVYALFALGFTLIFGVLEIISLAHGAVFMAGAFAGLTVATKYNLGIIPAMAAGMIAAGLFGLLIEFIALRPLRNRKHHHLAPMIATIGCATMITSLYQGVFGAEVYRFPFDIVYSDPCRPSIPIHVAHLFRCMSPTDSGGMPPTFLDAVGTN